MWRHTESINLNVNLSGIIQLIIININNRLLWLCKKKILVIAVIFYKLAWSKLSIFWIRKLDIRVLYWSTFSFIRFALNYVTNLKQKFTADVDMKFCTKLYPLYEKANYIKVYPQYFHYFKKSQTAHWLPSWLPSS